MLNPELLRRAFKFSTTFESLLRFEKQRDGVGVKRGYTFLKDNERKNKLSKLLTSYVSYDKVSMFLNSLKPCPEYCSKQNSNSSAFIQQT